MDVTSLIASFATGSYAVTRRQRSRTVKGRIEDGRETELSVTASVSPSSGKDLKRLPEGRSTNESRVVFTATQLFTGGQGQDYEADLISIDDITFEVSHVETWRDPSSGGIGYRCLVVSQ